MASSIGSKTHLFDENPHSNNQSSLSSKKTGGEVKSTFSNLKMAPSILETPVQHHYPYNNPLFSSTKESFMAPLTTVQKQRMDTLSKINENKDREFTPFLKTAKKKTHSDIYHNQHNTPSFALGRSTNSRNGLGVFSFDQLDQSMESSIMEPKIGNGKITQNGRQSDTSKQSSIPLKRQEEQVDQLSNEIVNLKVTIYTLEAQLKHYMGVDTTKDDILHENALLRKELLGVVQAYKKLQNDYVNLQKEDNNNSTKASNFQSANHQESHSDSTDMISEGHQLKKEIKKLDSILSQKDTEIENLKDEVSALKQKLDKEEEKVHNYEQQLFSDSKSSSNSFTIRNKNEQEEKIRNLGEVISSLQDQILEKDNKIEEIEAELENVKASKLKELQLQREELQAIEQQDVLQQTKEDFEREKNRIIWEKDLVSIFIYFTLIFTY